MTIVTRIKAAAIHLAISVAIAVLAVLFSVLVWYPPPLFEIMGGLGITAIMVGVDVALGPLITLFIFNTRKPRRELVMDYSIIGLVQIAALVYGISVLAQARPVYVVFVKDRFNIVRPIELGEVEASKLKYPEFMTPPWTGPRNVVAVAPTDPAERTKLLDSALSGKGDIETMRQYYAPYEERVSDVVKALRSVEELRKKRADQSAEIDRAIKDTGLQENQLGYLPYVGKKKDIAVLIEKANGAVRGYAKVDPW